MGGPLRGPPFTYVHIPLTQAMEGTYSKSVAVGAICTRKNMWGGSMEVIAIVGFVAGLIIAFFGLPGPFRKIRWVVTLVIVLVAVDIIRQQPGLGIAGAILFVAVGVAVILVCYVIRLGFTFGGPGATSYGNVPRSYRPMAMHLRFRKPSSGRWF